MITRATAKREAPATALPARYLVEVGDGSPDVHDTFAEAHAAWLKWTSGRGKLWRNDGSDDGEHLDGLSDEERSIVEEPLEEMRAETEHLARINRPHRSESESARRDRGLRVLKVRLPEEYIVKLDALCDDSGFSRSEMIMGMVDGETDELARIRAKKKPRAV